MTEKEKLSQKVIFLDLDKVLFDTERFKEELAKIFNAYGEIDFYKTYQRNRLGNYSLGRHLAMVKGRDKRSRTRQEAEILLADSYKFLFPDVKDFLERFRNDHLILLTRGETEFQQKKIFNLGINIFAFFSQVVTTEVSKADMVEAVLPPRFKDSGNVFFIDDTPEEIIDIRNRFDFITCILVDRSKSISLGKSCPADFMARNLHEAGDLIGSY